MKANNIPAAVALIERGADINVPNNYNNTALHMAAEGELPLVKSLIKKGADINARDGNGVTPLDIAEEIYEGEGNAAKNKRAEEIKVALKRAGGKRGRELD